MKILGIDIGGTTIKIGLIENKKIIKKYSIKTNKNRIIEDIIDSLKENEIDKNEINSIGCAIAGFIDHKKGIIKLSGNLDIKNWNFKKEFEKKIQKKVFIINDANAAALGEYWVGAGKKDDSIIFYTIGTGVGGGIILNNELIFGSMGYAGELGHGGNFQNERNCSCGLKNCLEPMSSATGIEKSIKEITGKDLKIIDVVDLFLNKDEQIIKAFKKSLLPLALHISIMETSINPDSIIIGGGPSNIGDSFAQFISELVKEVQLDFIHEKTPIKIATTKNDAGIFGAAYWSIKN